MDCAGVRVCRWILILEPQAAVTLVPSRVPFSAIALSAGFLALSFPLADTGVLSGFLGWCAVFAYVPLLVWMGEHRRSLPVGGVFAVALLVHVLAYGAAFHWVLFHPNPTTIAASIGGVLTLALLASIPLAAAAWTARHAGSTWLLAIWAALMLGLEHVLSVGPWALPWPVLSMTQAALPHAGLARWIGAPGLTALILLANATGAAWLIWHRQQPQPLDRDSAAVSVQRSGVSANSEHPVNTRPWRIYGLATTLGLTFLLAPALTLPGQAPSPEDLPPLLSQPTSSDGPQPTLLIVQPGMDSDTWAREDPPGVIDRLMQQTSAAVDEVSSSDTAGSNAFSALSRNDSTRRSQQLAAIVWPETAISVSFLTITDYKRRFSAFAQSLPAPLLAGAILESSRDTTGSVTGSFYQNAALWLDPDTIAWDPAVNTDLIPQLDDTAVYAKHHLVPFAEQVPFAGTVPALQKFAVPSGSPSGSGSVAGYAPGPGPTVFPPFSVELYPSFQNGVTGELEDDTPLRIAPLICFETVMGPYARAASMPDQVTSGGAPTVFVALSHVGWWGRSAVLPQYRALTSLRSLETGLPIIVATVRGPSFTATPDGSVRLHTRWMQSTTVLVSIPEASPAPFSRGAEWIHVSIAVLLIVGCRYVSTTKSTRESA